MDLCANLGIRSPILAIFSLRPIPIDCQEAPPREPGSMPLYQAVQASAAFPGGFPPARLDARRHKFPGPTSKKEARRDVKDLILTDGGLYDNMGDQWARGFRQRTAVWPWLAKQKQPDQLVVVNASARVPWSPFGRGRIPLLGELLAFMRVTNIMYINTTNVRRQEIVRSYDPTEPDRTGELPGCWCRSRRARSTWPRALPGRALLPWSSGRRR